MSIIALRAWYLQDYEPISALEKRPPDIRLSKKSLLKSALRADFLDDKDEIKKSTWFGRYLEGENIEFYIDGSGTYVVSNIDLMSHEIYLTKQATLSQLEPVIYFSCQTEYMKSTEILREELQKTVEKINLRSRYPLTILESPRPENSPVRLSQSRMKKIRKSLLFIADTTAIANINNPDLPDIKTLIPSPNVCVEMGYAIHSKKIEHILLLEMQRPELAGKNAFDLPLQQVLQFADTSELNQMLTSAIEANLMRFRLF